jgi:hypothetical protein
MKYSFGLDHNVWTVKNVYNYSLIRKIHKKYVVRGRLLKHNVTIFTVQHSEDLFIPSVSVLVVAGGGCCELSLL